MKHNQICLYCREPSDSLNYDCTCSREEWTDLYRVLDIEIDTGNNPRGVAESFRNYSFDSPEGLLQYRGLPYPSILPNFTDSPGGTPLHELSSLGLYHGCQLFLKDEGANPSGCFKDRETAVCLLNSQFNNMTKAVIYSSGNAAASAAHYGESSGHQIVSFVAGDTYPEKIRYIQDHGADVVVIGGNQTNFEDGYRLFSAMAKNGIFAARQFDNWSVRNPYRVQGDKTIAVEIVKQLSVDRLQPVVPDYVIVPTANGTCLAGIWKGFNELKQAGIITGLPKIIPAGIKHASPVCKAVRLRKTDQPVRCDLTKAMPDDREAGSIIVAEEGYDSIEAARCVLESGGFEVELSASNLQRALIDFLEQERPLANKHSIIPEPASLTGLAAIHAMQKKRLVDPSDRVVAISTGDGVKAEQMILSLLDDRPVLQDMAGGIIAEKNYAHRRPQRVSGRKIHAQANLDSLIKSFYELQTTRV